MKMDKEPLQLPLDPVNLEISKTIYYHTMQIESLCKAHNLNKSILIQYFIGVILEDEK